MGYEKAAPFDQSLADEVCLRISSSADGLRKIAADLGIARSSVYVWLRENKDFADQYARAKETQQEILADEILDIADDTRHDTRVIYRGKERIEVENSEWVNRCRLQVDARKWLMSKLAPKKYGDKTEVTGANGGALEVVIRKVGGDPE